MEGALQPAIFGSQVVPPLGVAADALTQLNGLLGGQGLAVHEAARVLRTAMSTAQKLVKQIEDDLHG